MTSTIACLWMLFTGATTSCLAATVYLHNSDRLSGQIQKLEGKRLLLKTDYAGVVEIDWTMVEGIASDEALQFSMQNGMVLTGTVENAAQGMEVSAAPGTPILPHDVKAISRPVHEQSLFQRLSGSIELATA